MAFTKKAALAAGKQLAKKARGARDELLIKVGKDASKRQRSKIGIAARAIAAAAVVTGVAAAALRGRSKPAVKAVAAAKRKVRTARKKK